MKDLEPCFEVPNELMAVQICRRNLFKQKKMARKINSKMKKIDVERGFKKRSNTATDCDGLTSFK